jgi:hypothetical protein
VLGLRDAISLRGSRTLSTQHHRLTGLTFQFGGPKDPDVSTGVTIARVPARMSTAPTGPRSGRANGLNGLDRSHERFPTSWPTRFTLNDARPDESSCRNGNVRMMLLYTTDCGSLVATVFHCSVRQLSQLPLRVSLLGYFRKTDTLGRQRSSGARRATIGGLWRHLSNRVFDPSYSPVSARDMPELEAIATRKARR